MTTSAYNFVNNTRKIRVNGVCYIVPHTFKNISSNPGIIPVGEICVEGRNDSIDINHSVYKKQAVNDDEVFDTYIPKVYIHSRDKNGNILYNTKDDKFYCLFSSVNNSNYFSLYRIGYDYKTENNNVSLLCKYALSRRNYQDAMFKQITYLNPLQTNLYDNFKYIEDIVKGTFYNSNYMILIPLSRSRDHIFVNTLKPLYNTLENEIFTHYNNSIKCTKSDIINSDRETFIFNFFINDDESYSLHIGQNNDIIINSKYPRYATSNNNIYNISISNNTYTITSNNIFETLTLSISNNDYELTYGNINVKTIIKYLHYCHWEWWAYSNYFAPFDSSFLVYEVQKNKHYICLFAQTNLIKSSFFSKINFTYKNPSSNNNSIYVNNGTPCLRINGTNTNIPIVKKEINNYGYKYLNGNNLCFNLVPYTVVEGSFCANVNKDNINCNESDLVLVEKEDKIRVNKDDIIGERILRYSDNDIKQ